ncbi:YSC84-related protein [Salinimicrobium sp. GXAS 041]|uniref:lipid-binding SYLF domain-containing protein n=1 Tax=Salinimicrobium sp. GXAS 041 TaxID=3400806 RepID=UPI003C796098
MKFLSSKLYAGVMSFMLFFIAGNLEAQNEDQLMDDQKREVIRSDSKDALEVFKMNNPKLEQILDNAEGYAIFPNVGKGAYILGGAAGNGVLYQNGQVAGYSELRQIDIGFQIGGKAFRELIVFQTQEALNRFKSGNFEFEGAASAVIWDEGATEALQFRDGIGVAIIPKAGAMIGVSVGGQEFNYRPLD